MSDQTVRVFLNLFSDFDLTHWCVLTARTLRQRYRIPMADGTRMIQTLLKAGLLIPGPPAYEPRYEKRKRLTKVATYRVDPVYLLSKQDAHLWFQEIEEQKQREGILPVEMVIRLEREARDSKSAPPA